MHTVFALLCFFVVIHWLFCCGYTLIFPYPSGLLHWHCGNLTIAPVPVKQPWWIWINTSCEFIRNDCITTTKQSTTKQCAYFLWYTVRYQALCRNWLRPASAKWGIDETRLIREITRTSKPRGLRWRKPIWKHSDEEVCTCIVGYISYFRHKPQFPALVKITCATPLMLVSARKY